MLQAGTFSILSCRRQVRCVSVRFAAIALDPLRIVRVKCCRLSSTKYVGCCAAGSISYRACVAFAGVATLDSPVYGDEALGAGGLLMRRSDLAFGLRRMTTQFHVFSPLVLAC